MGAGGLVLLVSMFALKWYGLNGTLAPTAAGLGLDTSLDAWHGLSTLRWLLLLTVVLAAALVYLQGTRPAPALPVTFSALVALFAVLSTLGLIYRVLLNPPGTDLTTRAGAYVGLLAAAVTAYGGYRSMREEGIAEGDVPREIPTERPRGQGPT